MFQLSGIRYRVQGLRVQGLGLGGLGLRHQKGADVKPRQSLQAPKVRWGEVTDGIKTLTPLPHTAIRTKHGPFETGF